MDIRRAPQAEAVGDYIINLIKIGQYACAIRILTQLSDYIKQGCSAYPVDYYAEHQ
jgi:hypothetical protein